MKVKDRFTSITVTGKYGPERRAIYDHLQEKQISEAEAEKICQEEYGEFIRAKKKVAEKTVELIIAEMNLYNLTCEEGFEITIEDIITKFKQNEKISRKN